MAVIDHTCRVDTGSHGQQLKVTSERGGTLKFTWDDG